MKKISLYKSISLFVLVALFLCYEMAVQVSPGIITHQLMRDLHLNALTLGIMSGCYFYTYAIMQIPAGLLYDRFNVRLVIVFPLLICIIGTFLFGLSQTLFEGAIARLLMGAGSAFAFIGVLVVAADIFPKKHFALLAGFAQMLAAFGAMSGELPLVPLIHFLGWRHAMFFIASIGLFIVILIWLFLRYKKCPEVITHETKHLPILVSLKTIIANKQTWFIAIYACCLWAPMAAFASLWGVPYVMSAYHLSHASAAGVISAMWLGIAMGAPLLGWWSDYIKRRKLPLSIAALVGLISFSLVLFFNHIPAWSLGLFVLLAGAACAGQALSFALVRDINSTRNRATAIGFNNMAVVIAGALFQPLIGKLIQTQWNGAVVHGTPIYLASNYRFGLILLPICFLIGLIIAKFLFTETNGLSKDINVN